MDCRRAVENAALSAGSGAECVVGAKKRRYKGSVRASSIERVCGVSPQGGRRAKLSEPSLREQLVVLGCCPFARFPTRSGIAAISAEPSEDRLIGAGNWWRFLYVVLRSCLPWPCPRASYNSSRKPLPARRMRTSKVQPVGRPWPSSTGYSKCATTCRSTRLHPLVRTPSFSAQGRRGGLGSESSPPT